MKKLLSLLLLLCLCTGLALAEEAPVQYVNFPTLKEQAKEGWHKTYHVKGWDIEAKVSDINITKMELEKFPVPIVSTMGKWDLSDVNYAYSSYNDKEGFNYDVVTHYPKSFAEILPENVWFEQTFDVAEDLYAEENPMSPEDAYAFALEKIRSYATQLPNSDVILEGRNLRSRCYEIKGTDRHVPDALDKSKPWSEVGLYEYHFQQSLHGIPLFDSPAPGYRYVGENGIPFSYGGVNVGGAEDYGIYLRFTRELGIQYEDIPFASFPDVLKTLDAIMEEGYIYEIGDISLQYTLCENPEDVKNTYLLAPVWVLNCKTVQYKDIPFTGEPLPYSDGLDPFQNRYYIHAQTLAIYGQGRYDTKGLNWIYPPFDWKEVLGARSVDDILKDNAP